MIDHHEENPDYDAREEDDMRDSEEDRSQDSEQADAMAKLGELEDEDQEQDVIGDMIEITHDGKVTKEIVGVGEGKRLRMGYKTFIKYKAYFLKDHVIFDQSGEEPVELSLGDNSWPDGVQTGVEKMRKGEVAKIRIKRKHGFGRPLRVEELTFPKGYDQEGSAGRYRLISETIVYEVELVDFVERQDIEMNGLFLKLYVNKADKNEWETPSDRDEFILSIAIRQKETTFWKKDNWSTDLADTELSVTMHKVLGSLKRGEKSTVDIQKNFIPE